MDDQIELVGDEVVERSPEHSGTAQPAARRSRSPVLRERVTRAALYPVNFFRENRRIFPTGEGWGRELVIDGEPAEMTVFDRARAERHRLAGEAAEKALNVACSDQAKLYSLASEAALMIEAKIKRGFVLLGALGLACAGGVLGTFAAKMAAQPDNLLLQQAIRNARKVVVPLPPSAVDQREFYLWMLVPAVALIVVGLGLLAEWGRGPAAR